MKKIVSIVFLLIFLLPVGVKLCMVANYWMNKQEYIVKLCKNKNKPAMKCNGKCHLAKQMNEEESTPIKPSLPESIKFEMIGLCSKFQVQTAAVCNNNMVSEIIPYQFPSSNTHVRGVFRPPLF